jgi:hypothetical protein
MNNEHPKTISSGTLQGQLPPRGNSVHSKFQSKGGLEHLPNQHNDLLKHWENDVLPRLTPEMVYTDPSHCFVVSSDRYRGGSPFRQSKSGTSFVVWFNSLRFYDSGMGFAGDPISYIHSLKVGRWEYPRAKDWVEALRELSDRAGVSHLFPQREPSAQQIERARKWEERRGILRTVYQHCFEYLWSEAGARARTHLIEERGFTAEQLRSLQVGLYPTLESVQAALKEQRLDLDLASECGVLTRKWQGYAIFPWHNPYGEPLTMYGHWPSKKEEISLKKDHPGWKKERSEARRAWGKLSEHQQVEQPWVEPRVPKKYACWNPKDDSGPWLATKESPLYLDRAIKAGHKEVVVVEGVTDAALAQSSGDTRVVACVAASLSSEQVATMKRHGIERVIIALDPDSAGDKGISSCIKSLSAASITPYAAPRLPESSEGDGDPDEYIKTHGIEQWKQHASLDNATHGFRWKAQSIVAAHFDSDDELTDATREAILRSASGWGSTLDFQWHSSLATYFWPEISIAIGAMDARESMLQLYQEKRAFKEGSSKHSAGGTPNDERNSNGNSGRHRGDNGDNGTGGNGGAFSSFSSSNPDDWNDWHAPTSWKGEIGWFVLDKVQQTETDPDTGIESPICDSKGKSVIEKVVKFVPKCNFDFQVVAEVAAPGSETGGALVLQVKRSIEQQQHQVIINFVDCISARKFEKALDIAIGSGIFVNLKDEELKALIHVRLRDYRLNRQGKLYRLIDRYGQQSDGVWVFKDCQFTPDGLPTNQELSLWVFNPNLGQEDYIPCPILAPQNASQPIKRLVETSRRFFGSSNIHQVLLTMGWVVAGLHSLEIFQQDNSFPLLNLYGEPGSYKTLAAETALSLVGSNWPDVGMLARASVSAIYEHGKCTGSLPFFWDDPDRSPLHEELAKSWYNWKPRKVRGNAQTPHSPLGITSNHVFGGDQLATLTRFNRISFERTVGGDKMAFWELKSAQRNASGSFSTLLELGYPRNEIAALEQELLPYLPYAHARIAQSLAISLYYAIKIASLTGSPEDIKQWVIDNLCATENDADNLGDSLKDFIAKIHSLESQSLIGDWNKQRVVQRDGSQWIALHHTDVWALVDRHFKPATYNQKSVSALVLKVGGKVNSRQRFDISRKETLTYYDALINQRPDAEGEPIMPQPPRTTTRAAWLIPVALFGGDGPTGNNGSDGDDNGPSSPSSPPCPSENCDIPDNNDVTDVTDELQASGNSPTLDVSNVSGLGEEAVTKLLELPQKSLGVHSSSFMVHSNEQDAPNVATLSLSTINPEQGGNFPTHPLKDVAPPSPVVEDTSTYPVTNGNTQSLTSGNAHKSELDPLPDSSNKQVTAQGLLPNSAKSGSRTAVPNNNIDSPSRPRSNSSTSNSDPMPRDETMFDAKLTYERFQIDWEALKNVDGTDYINKMTAWLRKKWEMVPTLLGTTGKTKIVEGEQLVEVYPVGFAVVTLWMPGCHLRKVSFIHPEEGFKVGMWVRCADGFYGHLGAKIADGRWYVQSLATKRTAAECRLYSPSDIYPYSAYF